MQITKEETRTITTTVVTDILCDWCGETCLCRYGEAEGLVGASVTGGYGSRFIGDSVEFKFDICEKCLVERLFPQFKHPPAGWDRMDGVPITVEKAVEETESIRAKVEPVGGA